MAKSGPRNAIGHPARFPGNGVASVETLGEPTQLESVSYILAMTKPLVEIAKARDLPSLVYFLEMAVLDAADLESRLRRASPPRPARPSDREDEL